MNKFLTIILAILQFSLAYGQKTGKNVPYKNPQLPVEQRLDDLMGRMTLEEKTMMTGGSGTMTLAALPRIGISREWTFADSSSTVRAKMSRWDWSYCGTNDEATVLASLSGLASTWNVDLARRHGEVLGEEARVVLPRQILGSSIWNRVKCISRAQTTTPMGLDSETRRIYRTREQEEVTK